MKKQKQTRERSTQGRGANSFITEMALFTPETDIRVRRVIRLIIRARYVIRLNLKMELF